MLVPAELVPAERDTVPLRSEGEKERDISRRNRSTRVRNFEVIQKKELIGEQYCRLKNLFAEKVWL